MVRLVHFLRFFVWELRRDILDKERARTGRAHIRRFEINDHVSKLMSASSNNGSWSFRCMIHTGVLGRIRPFGWVIHHRHQLRRWHHLRCVAREPAGGRQRAGPLGSRDGRVRPPNHHDGRRCEIF